MTTYTKLFERERPTMPGLSLSWLLILLFLGSPVLAAGTETPRRRAKPPQWSQEVRDLFFDDASQQLAGVRPSASTSETQTTLAVGEGDPSKKERTTWSNSVEAETLETEIKRLANGLAKPTSTFAKFKNGGYGQCQLDYSLLAVLFSVVDEFEGEVRWQRDASAMRRHLETAAALCEQASEQSYAAATQVQSLLVDLLRGQAPLESASLESQQVERSQLMQRMEQSVEEVLGPALSNKKSFRRQSAEVAHESQLLAVLARVIVAEGYESADEGEFSDYADQLGEASSALAEASKEKNYEAARSAAGRLTQSCSKCHEEFRG